MKDAPGSANPRAVGPSASGLGDLGADAGSSIALGGAPLDGLRLSVAAPGPCSRLAAIWNVWNTDVA